MEKASQVYNKLKGQFVVKSEMPSKHKAEGKEQEEDGKETQNSGNCLSPYFYDHN